MYQYQKKKKKEKSYFVKTQRNPSEPENLFCFFSNIEIRLTMTLHTINCDTQIYIFEISFQYKAT